MATREMLYEAQDSIMNAISWAALRADERGEAPLAEEIRKQGRMIARRYGLSKVPGIHVIGKSMQHGNVYTLAE